MFLLSEDYVFPNPESGELLAVGGDLAPQRLLRGYAQGIFPWYNDTETPILWHSPAQRMVLAPSRAHASKSMRRVLRSNRFEVRYDTAFIEVLRGCAETPRRDELGTWLNPRMQSAYLRLHQLGYAHSVESWREGELVGGLYGVALGAVFFGESMFSRVRDASKAAFLTMARDLDQAGFLLIYCQLHPDHLERLGAREWPAPRFREALRELLRVQPAPRWPTVAPRWAPAARP
ncbi:MAG: leucyl/phenylalanyl-tRNA--protein transferase [Myxococcota bacterium]|nr:leucyl/phenylalanyl-tRNA--protein transferase [Myxococcota bacterium]